MGLEVISLLKPFLTFVLFLNAIVPHLFVWSPTLSKIQRQHVMHHLNMWAGIKQQTIVEEYD